MGNGPGIGKSFSIDIETRGLDDLQPGTLTQTMIEAAALQAAANFGRPNIFMMPVTMMGWEPNPQYSGTEWAKYSRLSKREHAFAKLQVFLIKFGLQKHLEDDDIRRADCEMVSKRLRRAKWARYQQRKSK